MNLYADDRKPALKFWVLFFFGFFFKKRRQFEITQYYSKHIHVRQYLHTCPPPKKKINQVQPKSVWLNR